MDPEQKVARPLINDSAFSVDIFQDQKAFFAAIQAILKRRSRPKKKSRRKRQDDDMKVIDDFLERPDCDLNFLENGVSPLSEAAKVRAVLEKLLEHESVDVNICNHDGGTAIFLATESLELDSVQLLIEKGAIVDLKDEQGRTPLSLAAELGSIELIEKLAPKANINSEDVNRRTPLAWAVSGGCIGAVEHLLGIPDVDVDHRDINGRTPLSLAAERGPIELIEKLAPKANINSEDLNRCTPFSWAAWHERVDIMQLLMKHGADPHWEDNNGHTAFRRFLQARYDSSSTPIIPEPAAQIRPSDLSVLVKSLSHLDRKDSIGRSWLSWAAEYGDTVVVDCFLSSGRVNPNLRDETDEIGKAFSRTPLIWALEKRHEAVANLLIEKWERHLSLHYLIEDADLLGQEKALELIHMLLEWEIFNVNLPDFEGRTPLHLACFRGDKESTGALIRGQAVLDFKDRDGRTALQHALDQKHIDIVNQLLIKLGEVKPVQSKQWFNLGNEKTCWIQLRETAQGRGFSWKPITNPELNWLPLPKERMICICDKAEVWSLLERTCGAYGNANAPKGPQYLSYTHTRTKDFVMTYISLYICAGEVGKATPQQQLGVAWVRGPKPEDQVNMFISMLPNGWIPKRPKSPYKFFLEFLNHLRSKWEEACFDANEKVDRLRQEQVKQKGRGRKLIDEIASNSLNRTEFRACLRSQTERLKYEVIPDTKFEPEQQKQLTSNIDETERLVTTRLDGMEQSARELLQIELAWVSINEAESIKRLSWITFIFLPLMFTSSLFGMNIDLLKENPDWRWYLLFGGFSVLLTLGLWMVFRKAAQWKHKLFAGDCRKLGRLYKIIRTYCETDSEDVSVKYAPDGNTELGLIDTSSSDNAV